MTIADRIRSLTGFFRRDHIYVLLGTAALAAFSYVLTRFMPTRSSFLGVGVGVMVCQVVLGA